MQKFASISYWLCSSINLCNTQSCLKADLYAQQAGSEPEKHIWSLIPAGLFPFYTNTTNGFNKHTSYWSWATRQHMKLSYQRSTRFITTLHAEQKWRDTQTHKHVRTHKQIHPHTHILKRQSLNTQMISHQCAPHTCTQPFDFFPDPDLLMH